MFRAVFSAFIGYAVMVACVMAGIAGICYALGNEFAFSGETALANTGWAVAMLISGFVASVVAGCVAAMVGGPKGRLAVRVLVSLIIFFGVMTFISQLETRSRQLPAGTMVRDLDSLGAGQSAVISMWYNAAMVVVGGIGAWIGGWVCRRRHADQAPEHPERL